MEWSPCGQPPSPPMSPINLEDDSPLCRSEHQSPEVEMEEPGTLLVVEPGKKFRFQSQFVLLTYKSHLPKDDYVKWFKDMVPTTKFLRLAHEAPDRDPLKCPYRHTHVVADLGLRPNYHDCHKFCYKNPDLPDDKVDKCGRIHCHIRRLPGVTGLADAKAYIGKEDRDNADLLAEFVHKGARLIERIQQAPSINMALKQNLKRIGDAAGIMAIFGCRPSMTPQVRIPDRPDKPWQVELLQEVEDKDCHWSHRKILWYVDKRGNTGKSWLSRYLSRAKVHEDGTFDWLCMSGINDDKEASHQLKEAIDSGFSKKGFIMDLARSFQFCEKFYKTLEDFKNGEVVSTKYRGGRLHFNVPWLVVFANFWPKVTKMSLDRWDIRRINVETEVAEHLPFDAEAPEEVPWNRVPMSEHILQERV
ncbi:replication-associated protein [Crucivirus-468]|nr:replication-associated protein [Crucivirus-468]